MRSVREAAVTRAVPLAARLSMRAVVLPSVVLTSVLVSCLLHANLVHAAAQPSLNVYFQSTLKDAAYQKATFDRVAGKWKSPAAAGLPKVGSKAVVQTVIARDGKLVSATVSMESGSKKWDDAALAAVRSSAPFGALPASYKFPTVEAHFHFSLK
ncbi:MAG: TonB family protein [Thermoanaerobaculia bacterium]